MRVKTADEVNSQVAIDEEDVAEYRKLLKGASAYMLRATKKGLC